MRFCPRFKVSSSFSNRVGIIARIQKLTYNAPYRGRDRCSLISKIVIFFIRIIAYSRQLIMYLWFCTVPPEILARGPLALEAYNNALAEGKSCVKRVPLMLIGQDRSGKTSLKKSLKGIVFDPDEDSTVGIDVDQYHFEVTNETWMTGKKMKSQLLIQMPFLLSITWQGWLLKD